MIVGVTWFNLCLIAEIANLVFEIPIPPLSKTGVIASMVVVALPQYFLLLYHGKYRRIARKCGDEPNQQRHRRGIVVSIYILLSLTLPLLGAVLRGLKLGTI
jgi:hypothetical protein